VRNLTKKKLQKRKGTRQTYVGSDLQLPPAALRVPLQALVDDGGELGQPRVLAQVVLGLAQEDLLAAVTCTDRYFLRSLK